MGLLIPEKKNYTLGNLNLHPLIVCTWKSVNNGLIDIPKKEITACCMLDIILP